MIFNIEFLKYAVQNIVIAQPCIDLSYKKACVFLIIFNKEDNPYILSILKTDTEGYPWRNQVALPGGHIDEKDKSPEDAVFRELKEELNIYRQNVELIGSIGHFQTINKVDIEVFLGLWDGNANIRYDPEEISQVFEIPINQLFKVHKTKKFYGYTPNVYDLNYPFNGFTIWGVTARILHFFIENLYVFINN